MSRAVLLQIRSRLQAVADPRKAPQMQNYMKSAMPYLGVSAPPLRKELKEVFSTLEFKGAEDWTNTVLYIWRNARFREEWYAAVAL